jgi:hypothetical protein
MPKLQLDKKEKLVFVESEEQKVHILANEELRNSDKVKRKKENTKSKLLCMSATTRTNFA